MGISSYSATASSNTSISGINIDEGCAPSGINNAIRQIMADIAAGVNNIQLPSATGTANAIVVTLSPAVTSYSGGQRFQALATATNTGATTINYGGGVINLKKRAASGGVVNLAPRDVVSGALIDIEYDGTQAILLNAPQYSHGADIASASTINLDTATGDYVFITGTTGITAITLSEGKTVTTKFSGVVAITNGASLIAPGGANYTTVAGDTIIWRGEASGVVKAIGGFCASLYAPLASPAFTGSPTAPTQGGSDNSTKIATTAQVQAAIAASGSAGALLAANNLSDLASLVTALGILGFSWTAGANDYSLTLPAPGSSGNVVIIKFGTYSQPSTTGTVTFPSAFPNNCFVGFAMPTNSNSGGVALFAVTGKSASALTVFSPATSTFNAYYLAIGN